VRGAGHLIYPAAFVLETGESAAGLSGASPQLQDAINLEPDGPTSSSNSWSRTRATGHDGALGATPSGLLARRNADEALGPAVLIELVGVEGEALRFITEARQQSSLTHTLFNPFKG